MAPFSTNNFTTFLRAPSLPTYSIAVYKIDIMHSKKK